VAWSKGTGGTIFGCLVLMAFGAFALFLGLPDNNPVKCGSEIMSPGDFCGPAAGTMVTADGRPPTSNYDKLAADQHAATQFAIILGVVFLAVGGAWLIQTLRSANRAGPPRG
jgi:hypothetical protein